jgi:hypothetical protein
VSDLFKTGLNALQNQLPEAFGTSVGDNAAPPDLNTAAHKLNQLVSAVKVPGVVDTSEVFDSKDIQSVNIARFATVQHNYGILPVGDCFRGEGAKEVLAMAQTMAASPARETILNAFDSDEGFVPDLDRHHAIVAYVVHQAASGITETAQHDVEIEPREAFGILEEIRGAQNALLDALESRGVETGLSPARQPVAARYLNDVKPIWNAGGGASALTASAA